MNVTAVHTGAAFPFTMNGRYFHDDFISRWSLLSYAGKPDDLSCDTELTLPDADKQILNEATIFALPDRPISVLVTSSGWIILSPEIRFASTAVGATFCGATGLGGGAGSGFGCGTPPPRPSAAPPSGASSSQFAPGGQSGRSSPAGA